MPRAKIFDDNSDTDVDFTTNNDYAKNYDTWRKKEEFHKLKARYGEEVLDENSSSSSDDDDEGVELTEEVEKQFFKTLSCLKNKDPKIYDQNIRFFDDNPNENTKTQKKKKEKPLYISDYERELILQKNGELSDNENPEDTRTRSPTYVEEQKEIKDSFKKVLESVTEDDEGEWGGMMKVRQKSEEEKAREESGYIEWLAGQKDNIEDEEMERDLQPLKEYWNNPKLDEGEKFLRDYILKKRFLNVEDADYIPTYEEVIHDSDKDLSEDEDAIERQDEFEHKYNFRFEEPDQEFIKRYPRTMEHSLRRTDDKRKVKRVETKERKRKEKQQKMEELKKLQELKRKEIEEKIEKIRDITGNESISFNDEDLEGDFDPDAYDKKMQSLFNEEFYRAPEEERKPEFPEIDDYLEIENFTDWDEGAEKKGEGDNTPHCEDDDFIMDCDYNPQTSTKQELIENSKGKKKRKRKSNFAKAMSQPKPIFDPNNKSYNEYLDEYYKFDCEDIIGDTPCRFKYRKVAPNSFGLTIEEILMAKDRELNKWCSLKKAVQIRPDDVERYEQIAYEKKGKNVDLKRKVLPSLFEVEEAADEVQKKDTPGSSQNNLIKKSTATRNEKIEGEIAQAGKKKKKKKKRAVETEIKDKTPDSVVEQQKAKTGKNKKKESIETEAVANGKKRRNEDGVFDDKISHKKPKKSFQNVHNNKSCKGMSDSRLSAYGINPKKFKNKLKYKKA